MTLQVIPIESIPDQTFSIELNGQECQIRIYLRYQYMYMDLAVDDKIIFQGQICLNRVNMIQFPYHGFVGKLQFVDTQSNEDPYYTRFGERWILTYVQ